MNGEEYTMTKYRKKPIVIEAVQFGLLNQEEIEEFVGGDLGRDGDGNNVIATLEGAMKVSINDWIIKDIQGEFYPVKPDIFEETYELVE